MKAWKTCMCTESKQMQITCSFTNLQQITGKSQTCLTTQDRVVKSAQLFLFKGYEERFGHKQLVSSSEIQFRFTSQLVACDHRVLCCCHPPADGLLSEVLHVCSLIVLHSAKNAIDTITIGFNTTFSTTFARKQHNIGF